jgi:hypothetical protein
VGLPVYQHVQERGLHPYGVLLHGGSVTTRDGRIYRVPKRDVISAAQVGLQNGRIALDATLPFTDVLVHELHNYRMTIDPATAHDSYSAWRERDHDDLVLALAMVCWYGDYGHKRAGVWATHAPTRQLLDTSGRPMDVAAWTQPGKWS